MDSVEEDEGDMVLLVEASNVVVEVDGSLIMGLLEDDGLMGVDGLLIANCSLDLDGCRLASPSVEL